MASRRIQQQRHGIIAATSPAHLVRTKFHSFSGIQRILPAGRRCVNPRGAGERYGALSTLVRASARPGLRPQTTSPAEPAVDDFEFLVTPRKYGLERDM